MKKQQKLQDAIGLVGEDLIIEAKVHKRKALRFLRHWYIPSVAAAVIVAIVVGAFVWNGGLPDEEDIAGSTIGGNGLPEDPPPNEGSIQDPTEPAVPDTSKPQENNSSKPGSSSGLKVQQLAAATYPQSAIYYGTLSLADPDFQETKSAWKKQDSIRRDQAQTAGDIDDFVETTIAEFLSGTESQVYSPLNLYISLAMLAEITNGNSRRQILDLVNMQDIESLRQKVSALWNSHYRDDGAVTSVLANSVWLDQKKEFDLDTLNLLAEQYYASSYQGSPGTTEFDVAMQQWINQQTGGLLTGKTEKTDPGRILSLVSAVYFRGKWNKPFAESETCDGIFHGTSGDTNCSFMTAELHEKAYYQGNCFTAIYQEIGTGGGMWLILPKEGTEVTALAADTQVLQLIQGDGTGQTQENKTVHLSMPKFDVSAENNMIETLKTLGVTDVFDPSVSDFSPLYKESGLMVYNADHLARVTVDEEGCTATAFTQYDISKGVPQAGEIVDFTLDRPFLFAVTSEHDIPLFIGTVQNP